LALSDGMLFTAEFLSTIIFHREKETRYSKRALNWRPGSRVMNLKQWVNLHIPTRETRSEHGKVTRGRWWQVRFQEALSH